MDNELLKMAIKIAKTLGDEHGEDENDYRFYEFGISISQLQSTQCIVVILMAFFPPSPSEESINNLLSQPLKSESISEKDPPLVSWHCQPTYMSGSSR